MSAQTSPYASAAPSPGRKIGDVEQELAVLDKQAEALNVIANEFERKLAVILPPVSSSATGQSEPKPVRVPLADMIGASNARLHSTIVHLNDILARIELPE